MEDKENEIHEEVNSSIFSKYKKAIISIIVILVAVVVAGGGYFYSVKSKVSSWEDKIYPGTNVYGIDLGGLTKEQATKALDEKLEPQLKDKKLKVIVGDKNMELSYADLKPNFDSKSLVDLAFKYGKDKGLFAKKDLIDKPSKNELSTKVTYDQESLKSFEEKVKSEVNIEPTDATISIGGSINITPEVNGKYIDEKELNDKLVQSISADPKDNKELKLELKEKAAHIKAADLQKITGKMSSFSNNYIDTGDGRVTNLKVASAAINGTVVMPGEEFSYNAIVGDTTPDKGYKKAHVYVEGGVGSEYGGGICQTSTALYRAIMRANIKPTERSNHNMTVSYSKPSLDATVYTTYPDFKFKNTYDFPIYIQAYVGGGSVTYSIYGDSSALGDKTYDMASVILNTYPAKTSQPGYDSQGYLVTYQNGVEISRELVSTDHYSPL